jgi:hypothetical protein
MPRRNKTICPEATPGPRNCMRTGGNTGSCDVCTAKPPVLHTMNPSLRFSQLSSARQALVRICQTVNFGEIQGVLVRDAEPVFGELGPVVVTDVKLDKQEEPRPELTLPDFELRHELGRLMSRLDELRDGIIQRIEVHKGLQRRIVFESRMTDVGDRPSQVAD